MSEFAQAPCALFARRLRAGVFLEPTAGGLVRAVREFLRIRRSRSKEFVQVRNVSAQPILALGGRGEFDEFGIYPVSVIRHDREVRAYYAGWTRCESVPFNVAIGVARSNDGGATFARLGAGPILSYTPDEPFVLSGPKIRIFNGIWYLWYIAGRKWKLVGGRAEPVYKIRMASSPDGLSWTKLNKDLIPSRIEDDEAQSGPDVYCEDGKYHMFFAYRYSSDFRGKSRGYRIGYAWSRNLTDWTREDEKSGIDVSDEGWDSEMISYPHVFTVDGKTYMAYLGNQVGREGFGLAELEGRLG